METVVFILVAHFTLVCVVAPLQVNSARTAMRQAEQDPNLPRLASNVLGKVHSHFCFTEWRGKGKCMRGKSTLGEASPAQKIMFCNLCCTMLLSDNGVIMSIVHYGLLASHPE